MKIAYWCALVLVVCAVGCSSDQGGGGMSSSSGLAGGGLPTGAVVSAEPLVYNVTVYGAVGDGKTDCTAAIQKAINACAAGGGGRVLVPSGTYSTGPITLASAVDLHVDAGAVVKFSRNFADYPLRVVDAAGTPAVVHRALITVEGLHDVAITGPGTFDGQGDAWRPVKKAKMTDEQWADLLKTGGVVVGTTWWPSQAAVDAPQGLARLRGTAATATSVPAPMEQPTAGPATAGAMTAEVAPSLNVADYLPYGDFLRPNFLAVVNCQGVLLDGPTLTNSPDWTVQLTLSQNIVVRHVTVDNAIYAQNGDGIDLDSSRDVLIEQDTVNAGDDNICLKSGKDEAGRKRARATENVTIRDCTCGWGHGAIVIGSETSGNVRDVFVSNITCKGTDIGLRFKSVRGRGGVVENVHVDHVTMSDIKTAAISFDMYYEQKKPTPEPASERTPCFRKFEISDVNCSGARDAIVIRGLPELPVSQIVFQNVTISADNGATLTAAKDLTFRSVKITCKKGPPFVADDVTGIDAEGLDAETEEEGK